MNARLIASAIAAAVFTVAGVAAAQQRASGLTLAAGADAGTGANETPPPPVHVVVGCEAPCPALPRHQDEFRTLGLRVSETHVKIANDSTTSLGVLLAFDHHQYTTTGFFTTRSLDFGFIGGGSGGFEGGLGGDFAFGVRVPLGPAHGPFARLGFKGYLYGNDDLYNSILELPTGQLGYQILVGHQLLLELSADAAPVLVGRYNVGDARPRKLGKSFDYGGHLGFRAGGVHLELAFSRIDRGHDSALDPLDVFRGELCAAAWPIALCADGRAYHGPVFVPRAGGDAIGTTQSYYLGAHFGVLTESRDNRWHRHERRRHRAR